MEGWISINRSLRYHWIYKDDWKLKCWIDILLSVNHTETKVNIKGEIFTCGIGETLRSLDTYAKDWNCTKSKVRRFLKLLESDSMIVLKDERKTTRLTVCNYITYQNNRNANETQTKRKRNANETQVTPNNNVNNEYNENNKSKQFTKPTLEQVQEYCSERKNNVDPSKWINYYESNGWKVGKNTMKDWKAAIRTWEGNGFSNVTSSTNHKPRRPDITGDPAYAATKVPAMMESLISKGWTEAEIWAVVRGEHDGVGGLDY